MSAFLTKVVETFTNFGFRLIAAIIVLVVGWFLIGFALKLFAKSKKAQKIDPLARKFIVSFINIGLKILLMIIVVSILGVNMTSVIAVLTSCALAIGLALQGGLSNIAGGLIILIFRPFEVGDLIESDGALGTVSEVNIFYTVMVTPDNIRVTIPNATVSNSKIQNLSAQKTRRMDFDFVIPFNTKTETAQQVLLQVAKENDMVLADPAASARISGYTDRGVQITLRVWATCDNYWDVYFDINEAVKEAFAACKIKFAYQQLDIHVAQ